MCQCLGWGYVTVPVPDRIIVSQGRRGIQVRPLPFISRSRSKGVNGVIKPTIGYADRSELKCARWEGNHLRGKFKAINASVKVDLEGKKRHLERGRRHQRARRPRQRRRRDRRRDRLRFQGDVVSAGIDPITCRPEREGPFDLELVFRRQVDLDGSSERSKFDERGVID